jgi:membrane-bound transcription factor site-1 protease
LEARIILKYIPTPPRYRRLLFDYFHQAIYPYDGYIAEDDYESFSSKLTDTDRLGDHPFTNLQPLYSFLVEKGYYIEILAQSFNCFDANNYGALLVIDPEDYFSKVEIQKIRYDVKKNGLGLVIFADWYNAKDIDKLEQFSEAENIDFFMTGSNVPALNELVHSFGIQFG